jgi:hypothetical protein
MLLPLSISSVATAALCSMVKKPYRFVSVNIPNYFILEDRAGKHGKKWHRVTEFEQRDAARAVKRMGGQVFRSYTFAVDGGKNLADKLAHIYADERGRIRYNEELFRDVDRGKLLLWIFPMRFHSVMTARLLPVYPFSVISPDPDYGLTG